MPVIVVNMIEGRSDDQKRALVDKVTKAVCESINSVPEKVRIIINEMPKNGYAVGGKLMIDNEQTKSN
jgi:4-oxalocrotonate tautomerase